MSVKNTTIDEILENFEFLEEWEDRYKYIIDLGKQLVPLAPEEMIDSFKVRGCQSQVWLVPTVDAEGLVHLRGDSDAFIVKGLVAVLLAIYSGKSAEDILAIDAKENLGRLELASHLSPMRANGLFSMVERIRAIAGET